MPHAQSMPSPGFQALILCGPGVSLNTFTSNQEVCPKALVPVANRPMVWYPLEWCYRMGVTNIHLITPPSSAPAVELALATNPHLTSLPLPKPDILSPADLSQNTGTAEIFRLPEVRAVVTGDFIVLPCDLISELGGEALLESWMIQSAGLGGATSVPEGKRGPHGALNGEKSGRRGGLGVWYQTKGPDSSKGQETDFIAISPPLPTTVTPPQGSLLPHISSLFYTVPTDTLHDIAEARKTFPVRHALLRKHPRVKMLTTHRDAHIYFFPYWTLDMIGRNETFDSISEDVVGWWAKAGWQGGLGDKLGLRTTFGSDESASPDDTMLQSGLIEDEIDLGSLSTTWTSSLAAGDQHDTASARLASRVQDRPGPEGMMSNLTEGKALTIPPIFAYVHPSAPAAPVIRRCDTTALLLSLSLQLARLPAQDSPEAPLAIHPFSHRSKIVHRSGVAGRSTVTQADCLLAENVIVEEKCVVKESVLGAGCKIGTGARLTRCVLMDDVVVGERAQLSGCVLGKRCSIGREAVLRDCEVQEGYAVPDKSDAKNEKFMVFEGLDDGENSVADAQVSI
ncbi:MAG: hypothetical protein M1832_001221 [Thelocarpon impressellum]|nr:MAG: hypothetical protein M1832_001221 [Thelocarpon impressellum]